MQPPTASAPSPAADLAAIQAALIAVRQAADVVCDRWTLALVLALLLGESRFGALMQRTGMASRLLTARLRTLETSGLVFRMPYSMHPPRHEYRLTNMGADLVEVVVQMARWEQAWITGPARAEPDWIHLVCGAPLRTELRCGACGAAAGARDIDLKLSRAQLQQAPEKQTAHRRSTVGSEHPTAVRQLLGPSLDIFGDKWGIEVLVCAFFRVRRFNDFRSCTGIAANILSDRLDRLVGAGILNREPDTRGYRLTRQGVDLYGVVVVIQEWADNWLGARYRSPVRLIHRACGEVFRPLTTCVGCDRAVTRGEVEFAGGAQRAG